jgi:hypothetical protein
MGLLTKSDSTLYRGFFKEMARLRGIHVKYQFPIEMQMTLHAEERPKAFSEPIEMDIIFEENPKVSTLRKYGWATGINEDYPFMASLPYDAKNLCKGCRIIIPAPMPLGEDELFVITDIKSNLDFPDSFICKVAPINEDRTDIPTNYENTNTNFLKVDL